MKLSMDHTIGTDTRSHYLGVKPSFTRPPRYKARGRCEVPMHGIWGHPKTITDAIYIMSQRREHIGCQDLPICFRSIVKYQTSVIQHIWKYLPKSSQRQRQLRQKCIRATHSFTSWSVPLTIYWQQMWAANEGWVRIASQPPQKCLPLDSRSQGLQRYHLLWKQETQQRKYHLRYSQNGPKTI